MVESMPSPAPVAARSPSSLGGVLAGMLAMSFVGGSVAVSGVLEGAPFLTAQALRYAAASAVLAAVARAAGRPLHRPRGVEWCWLIGLAGTGQVIFNVALVLGSAHAEPAAMGVAVACVPIVLAILGPILDGRRPRAMTVVAAVLVTAGAVLVQGAGRTDATGLGWALVVLVCEAGFTVLAVPLMARHGPWGISVHGTWVGAVAFAVLGLVVEGPAAAGDLRVRDLAAMAYLAVVVTAVAFVLWYSTVRRLGAGRAGLLTGLAPVAAAAVGVVLGEPVPTVGVWSGVAVVAGGLALGLAPWGRSAPPRPAAPGVGRQIPEGHGSDGPAS